MKNEMMDAVVYKMMLDLDRIANDMNEDQKAQVRKAMSALVRLRVYVSTEEEAVNA